MGSAFMPIEGLFLLPVLGIEISLLKAFAFSARRPCA